MNDLGDRNVPPPFFLRTARPEEIALVCDKLAELEPWVTLKITASDLKSAFARDKELRRVQVAVEGDKLLGVVSFRTTRATEYIAALQARGRRNAGWGTTEGAPAVDIIDGGYVNCLAVFGSQQGRGIGLALLRHAEAETAVQGSERLYLCVSDFNTAAQRFYHRHGYTECTRIANCVIPGRDELLLFKPLSSKT